VQHERGHGNALYLTLFVSGPPQKMMVREIHPLIFFYESRELQRMAGDRNVRVAMVDEFRVAIMRPKTRLSEGVAEEWGSMRASTVAMAKAGPSK
jgi:hypothetical protein